MDISQYEQYFIYDKPVPYITKKSLMRRKEIEQELSEIKLDDINNKLEIKFSKLKEEYDSLQLLIYPVKISEYLNFHIAVNCLSIEKNKIPDPKIISMSYLDFLFYLIENDNNGNVYTLMLIEVFKLCLNIENGNVRYCKDENGKTNLNLYINSKTSDFLYEQIIDRTDFDEIRKIILYQNIPDYNDTYIDPKMEKALQEAQDFMSKNKKKRASFEDQLICVLISTSLSMEDIYNLTIRKFSKILQRVDYKLHYEIYKTASMSGFVEFKQEIDHWMSDLSVDDKYADAKVDFEEFKNKINGKGNGTINK
jgi:hypothetical protein